MGRVKARQDSEKEMHILYAIKALNSDPELSIRAAARKFGVPRTTLQDRYHQGARPKWEAHEAQQNLTKEEEDSIEAWVDRLDDIGIPPRLSHLYEMAASIIRQRSSEESKSQVRIGDHWITRFLDRHPHIAYRYSARVDNERASAGNPTTINQFFNRLAEVRSRYHILPENTYNADEKGYAIGLGKRYKVLVRRNRRTSRIRQPGNREWVSVLECVSVKGKLLPAYLIYKGKAHLMGNHDYVERDEATFGLSDSGWSDDQHGFKWLSTHFDPLTATSTNDHRLLIIDGHSSHLTVEFVEYCLDHNIHLLCLPPHSTHLLQPLDVGLFSPLKQYYSNLLDLWTRTHPYQRLNKGDFFPLLMKARRSAFTEKNIKSAFATTGIFPFRRNQVLNILQHQSTAPKSQQPALASAPTNAKEIQHLKLTAEKSESLDEVKQICLQLATAAGKAFADRAIAQETVRQLTTAQKKSHTDRRYISKARVLTRTDLDHLRALRLEKERKKAEAAAKRKAKGSINNTKGKKRSRNVDEDLPAAKRRSNPSCDLDLRTSPALDSDSE